MRSKLPSLGLGAVLSALALPAPSAAQGDFVNYETPQVKPIAIANVGGVDWLLACNTPDNSVEVRGASWPYTLVRRVPVGLGPVTVRWHASLGRFYVCNFDGDSVTTVDLQAAGSSVNATVANTTFVGDEPCDITFTTDNQSAIVTLNSRKAITMRKLSDMSVQVSEAILTVPNTGVAPFAVKQPRMIQTLADGRILVQNFMGDKPVDALRKYDLDFYYFDPGDPVAQIKLIDRLGTTNHSFAVQSDGKRMFAVGTLAQHNLPGTQSVGVKKVSALATGFVQSWMWVVDLPPGRAALPMAEAPAGQLPAPTNMSINLGRDYSSVALKALPRANVHAQPTDIVLWTPNLTPEPEKIFIAAFHSDKVAVLAPDTNSFGGWKQSSIALHAPTGNYSVVGPRGLAISYTATDPNALGDSGLVYVMNRLENSVSILDPVSELEVRSFALANDPTPDVIRRGRKLLYSTQFSGSGSVSCASCHVDGRTDGLAWNIGNVDPNQPTVDPWLNDGTGMNFTTFPTDKGPMMTQTLQGLVTYPVNVEMQALFTTAPYHWRGDKRSVHDFNEAFVTLQGMPNIGTPSAPRGVTSADMQKYVDFVNTIRHPPNYEEPINRIPTGSLDPVNPQDPKSASASGARLGMLIFHDFVFADGKTCAQCHTPPAGSSDTLPLQFSVPGTLQSSTQNHPFESAATRNLIQREMVVNRGFTNQIDFAIGNFGLLHPGDLAFGNFFALSINNFIWQTFRAAMPAGTNNALRDKQTAAVTEFIRQLDTGIAPAAGLAYTLLPGPSQGNKAANTAMFDLLEDQVWEANIGLAVHTRSGSTEKGYWFDVTAMSPRMYREEGTANFVDRAALQTIADTAGNAVILQGTPVGSQRRVASLSGTATVLTGGAPTGLKVVAMAPAKHWLDIVNPLPGASFNGNITNIPKFSLRSRHEFWKAITTNGMTKRFGIPTAERYEAPRRFRVAGSNLRQGCVLFLGFAGPGGMPQSNPQYLALPLFPTQYTDNGLQVWESTVESAPLNTLELLSGGPWADGVVPVAHGNYTPNPKLDPVKWNFCKAVVFNEDLTFGSTGWQPLSVQDTR